MSHPSDAIRQAVAASRQSAVNDYANGQPAHGSPDPPRGFADRVIGAYLDATYGPGSSSRLGHGEIEALRSALYWDTVADQFPGADVDQAATIAKNRQQAAMYAQTVEHGLALARRDDPGGGPSEGEAPSDPISRGLTAVLDKIPGLVAMDPQQRQDVLLRAVEVARTQAGSDQGRFQGAFEAALLVSESMLAPSQGGGDAGAAPQNGAPPSNATPAPPAPGQPSHAQVGSPSAPQFTPIGQVAPQTPPPTPATASGAVSIPGGESAGAGSAEPVSPYKLAAAQARARAQATYSRGIPTQPGGGVPVPVASTPK